MEDGPGASGMDQDSETKEIDEAIIVALEGCGTEGINPSILANRVSMGSLCRDSSRVLRRVYDLRDEGSLRCKESLRGLVVLQEMQLRLPLDF